MTGHLDVLYIRAGGQGWGPVDELAALTARLLRGELRILGDRGEVPAIRKLAASLPRRRSPRRSLLVIAPSPAHLAYAARVRHWLPGYDVSAAWVIDSFWTDRISRMARRGVHFDHLFITDPDLVEEWHAATGTPVSPAPWGTDTLRVTDAPIDRTIDLVRIGRQPPAWDDDDRTRALAESRGLVVEGRPPFHPDPARNQDEVRSALRRSKFVLAFSNLVSPAPYTHPTREYLTGRWTDALGAGATVAGLAPASASATLWPGATVDLDPHDLEHGLDQLRDAVRAWTPDTARVQSAQARARLDWRWRIRDIAAVLGRTDLDTLHEEIGMLASTGGPS